MQRVSIPFLALVGHDALLIVDTTDSSTTTGTLPELYTPFLKTPIILTGSLICFCRLFSRFVWREDSLDWMVLNFIEPNVCGSG